MMHYWGRPLAGTDMFHHGAGWFHILALHGSAVILAAGAAAAAASLAVVRFRGRRSRTAPNA
jgi:hypothetical protein